MRLLNPARAQQSFWATNSRLVNSDCLVVILAVFLHLHKTLPANSSRAQPALEKVQTTPAIVGRPAVQCS